MGAQLFALLFGFSPDGCTAFRMGVQLFAPFGVQVFLRWVSRFSRGCPGFPAVPLFRRVSRFSPGQVFPLLGVQVFPGFPQPGFSFVGCPGFPQVFPGFPSRFSGFPLGFPPDFPVA